MFMLTFLIIPFFETYLLFSKFRKICQVWHSWAKGRTTKAEKGDYDLLMGKIDDDMYETTIGMHDSNYENILAYPYQGYW